MFRVLPVLLLICVGCAQEEPPADAAQVERLLARLEADRQSAADRLLSERERERLSRAERLVAPIEKLPPEKIDPAVAEALISR